MTRQDLLLCSDRLCDNNTPHYHTHCHSVSPPLEQETLQTSEATPEAGQENGIPGSQNSDNSMNPINLETKPSKTVAMSSDETTRRRKKNSNGLGWTVLTVGTGLSLLSVGVREWVLGPRRRQFGWEKRKTRRRRKKNWNRVPTNNTDNFTVRVLFASLQG